VCKGLESGANPPWVAAPCQAHSPSLGPLSNLSQSIPNKPKCRTTRTLPHSLFALLFINVSKDFCRVVGFAIGPDRLTGSSPVFKVARLSGTRVHSAKGFGCKLIAALSEFCEFANGGCCVSRAVPARPHHPRLDEGWSFFCTCTDAQHARAHCRSFGVSGVHPCHSRQAINLGSYSDTEFGCMYQTPPLDKAGRSFVGPQL
jgi:hypothetical protein